MASLRVILDDSWEDGDLPAVIDVFSGGERRAKYVPECTCHVDIIGRGMHGSAFIYKCSECGKIFDGMYGLYRYCPRCGAKVVNDNAGR